MSDAFQTPFQIETIILQARSAQHQWNNLEFDQRARLLKRAGKKMLERRQEVLELLHAEAGKTPADMLLSEAIGPLQFIKDWIKIARPYLQSRKLSISPLAFPGKSGRIEIIPRGVVGVISPWNFPLGNFFKPVFAALICGNTVIIKPSEYSPRTAEWFVELCNLFLPPNVLQLVQGDRHAAQALIKGGLDAQIDAVTFTGSFYSGREVAHLAAEQMIPCSLELGGKDAAVVLSNCNLTRTVAGIMNWSLQNTGQACGDIERVYIENDIADSFVSILASALSRLRFSSGETLDSDLGPLVNSKQLQIVHDHVTDAIARGARLVHGGKPTGKGLWYEPTLLDHCNHTMKVMREPTFGPVIPIVRVKNTNEAIQFVNDCDYGLNASIWSQDLKLAQSVAKKLNVGTVFINNHAFTGALPSAPWTGVKKSGYGIANSTFALHHYTRPQTIVVDRKKTADAWWLPHDAHAEELGQSLAEAQLGKVGAALKLPWLIFKRERFVLDFVRGGSALGKKSFPEMKGPSMALPSPKKEPSLVFTGTSFRENFFFPGLTRLELSWAQSAIEAIYHHENFTNVPKEQSKVFINDLYRSMPLSSKIAMRFAFWVIGLSPIFKMRKFKTIDKLSMQDRLDVLKRFEQSNSYVQKQIILLLKMNGALSEVSTSRMARHMPHQIERTEPNP